MIKLGVIAICLYTSKADSRKRYRRPKWRELLYVMNTDVDDINIRDINIRGKTDANMAANWGKTAIGKYADYTECPPLSVLNSTHGVFCNGASCVLNCDSGFHPNGNSRTNCQKSKTTEAMEWSNTLAECVTCEDHNPVFTDENIGSFCYIHGGTNEKTCELSCKNGGELTEPIVKGNEVRCKCDKLGDCFWTSKKGKSNKIETRSMKCLRSIERTRVTPCSEKGQNCETVKLYENSKINSATFYDSWECRKCYVLKVKLKKADFDNQDFIDIDFNGSIREVHSWSYPVTSVSKLSMVDQNGVWQTSDSERWRIGFDQTANLKDSKLDFSISLKVSKKPLISAMSICPCGAENSFPTNINESIMNLLL